MARAWPPPWRGGKVMRKVGCYKGKRAGKGEKEGKGEQQRGVGDGLGDRPRLDIKGNGGKQEKKGGLR